MAALAVAYVARAQATEALAVEGRAREAQRAASGAAAEHAPRRSARNSSRTPTPLAPSRGASAPDGAPDTPALAAVPEGAVDGEGVPHAHAPPRLSREGVALGVAAELAVAEADDFVAATASFRVRAKKESLAAEEDAALLGSHSSTTSSSRCRPYTDQGAED